MTATPAATPLAGLNFNDRDVAIAPDGRHIAYVTGTPVELYVRPLDQLDTRVLVPRGTARAPRSPFFSPDGKSVGFFFGQASLQRVGIDGGPPVWQISTAGGAAPLWSRNGRELFYWVADQAAPTARIMSVSIEMAPSFASTTPRMVIAGPYLRPQAGRPYDVTPDGKRLLVMKDGTPARAAPIELVVVLNWFEELRRLVPAN